MGFYPGRNSTVLSLCLNIAKRPEQTDTGDRLEEEQIITLGEAGN
jgi:hypothetical protein